MEPEFSLPSLSARYQSFITESLESHNPGEIKELSGRRIRGCFHGWVILSNNPTSVLWSLWNPLTSKLIRLPPLISKDEEDLHNFCLSSPPDDDKVSIFLFTTRVPPNIVFCQLDRKRKRLKWTEMSCAKQLMSISEDFCYLSNPTCCNGKVYATIMTPSCDMVTQVDIVVIKGKEVVISLLPFVKLPNPCYNQCPYHNVFFHSVLKGSCAELFHIDLFHCEGTRTGLLQLFRLDMDSMTWEEMKDLKDSVFLLEMGTCLVFYKSKVASDIGGFVHLFGCEGSAISSFHVRDKTVSLTLAPCIERESQLFAWAMLECGVEANHPKSKQQEEKDDEMVVKPVEGEIKTEFDITTSDSCLLNIPFHILERIMELCVGVEYMNFRATCKRCSLAAPSIQWSSKTSLRRLHMYSLASAWLMVLDNYRGIMTFIDPLYGDMYFIKTPQELKGDCKIYCSRFGWLLMYNNGGPLVFFNPFTSVIRELPMIRELETFCFSAPPTSPDCMVVGFKPQESCFYIHFVAGESLWTPCLLDLGSDDIYSFHFPAFIGRDTYVLVENERIEAIREVNDVDDYSWEFVAGNFPRRHPEQYFLSSCDQHLLLVSVGEFGQGVEVFKLNDSTKKWEQIENLGKQMIYVSRTSCICLEAKSPEMENKIFFPRLLQKEKGKIVFYSLETCKYHTFRGKIIQQSFGSSFLRTNYLCSPHTWIEPTWL